MQTNKTGRVASIDIARASTMLLMIWVNDFWTLENIPKWLEHAKSGEDYLGFSDLIFPWFLFIVGLSIPFAINNRLNKGDSKTKILRHIITRSLALLIMGIYLVNIESYHAEATGIPKPWFVILTVACFFLIWNVYPKATDWKIYLFYGLQVIGVILLVYLGIIYRGTTYGDENAVVTMQTRWWGILGLIGWAYLVAAPLYLFLRNVPYSMWIGWIVFIVLNIAGNHGIDYNLFPWQSSNWVVGNGAFHAFAFGGIVTSELLIRFRGSTSPYQFYAILLGLSVACLIAGFISHNYFIVSKNAATPPWVCFSLASAFVLFVLLHWLVDHHGKANWFVVIKTAGTATLTCYLVPYFFYSFVDILGLELPHFLNIGLVGLLKSMTYAFIIVGITWMLGKVYIKLKI